ncbi:MAG: hypothetical protein HY785_28865 [Oscillatoriophycideae cyanobacterium NC_groundwater_1537_Pr4_S-0.65um_50_18]|nr:hypothetical protein [Oscillatoriophycideae cyanobacterium NC_groundwater_1537_Pr4_S-0.65um_50_18]
MKLISKITAGTLLGFGLAVTLAMMTNLAADNTTAEDRSGAIAAFAFFGLPPAALGGWMFWNGHRKYHQERSDRLRNTFFKVLKASDGNITPLQFSMESGLDGAEAKVYLDERAKEFNANFNVTPEGNLIYYFEL